MVLNPTPNASPIRSGPVADPIGMPPHRFGSIGRSAPAHTRSLRRFGEGRADHTPSARAARASAGPHAKADCGAHDARCLTVAEDGKIDLRSMSDFGLIFRNDLGNH
jgi:hypothetical protein